MDFYDDMEFDGFDDELMEADGFEFEALKNGKTKPVTTQQKSLAKAVVKAINATAAKAQGAPPAAAKRKATDAARKAIAKVEHELYEGLFEDEAEEYELEAEDMLDPELLAEMNEVAEMAAEAEDEAEADEFLGILGSLAAKAAPMLLRAAPGIISSLMGEEEFEDGYAYESDFYDEEGDEFFGALAGLASAVLPKIVKGVGRLFRSRGARKLIRRLPGVVMGAARRTARSGTLTPGNFVRNLGLQSARAVMSPYYRHRHHYGYRRHYGYGRYNPRMGAYRRYRRRYPIRWSPYRRY